MIREEIINKLKELRDAKYSTDEILLPLSTRKMLDEVIRIISVPEPQELDEASEEYGRRQGVEDKPFAIKHFKAGAKWMAGQGGYFEDTVFLFQNHPMLSGVAVDCVSALEKAGAKSGDKVIIQIRKK